MQDDPHERTASAIIKDFEGYGYSKEEIMALADEVASKGRGGDELLAYLSPESVEFLKSHGGSGTINPITGLPEFKGGVIGKVVNAVKSVFGRRSAAPAAAAAAPADKVQASNMAYEDSGPKPPSAAELMKQLEESNTAKTALQTKYDTDMASFKTQAQKDQEAAVAAALKADAEKRAATIAAPVIGQQTTAAQDLNKTAGNGYRVLPSSSNNGQYFLYKPDGTIDSWGDDLAGLTEKMNRLNQPAASTTGGTAKDLLTQVPASNTITATPTRVVQPTASIGTAPKSTLVTPEPVVQKPVSDVGWTSKTRPTPKDRITTPGSVGSGAGTATVTGGPIGNIQLQAPNISFNPLQSAAPLPQLDLRGRITSPIGGRATQGGSTAPRTTAQGPDVSGTFEGQLPYVANTPSYSDRGVGSIGSIDSGNIPIFGPSGPSFGSSPIGRGGAATNPSSYFAMTPQTSTGLAPGSAAIGPADMPLYGAKNTMGAIGANSNLSPTMLGGVQNAGVMTDRLGNRIYSPGMNNLFGPPGFAKGGGVDLAALNAENMSDEPPEETINTNPVGSAQQMLADLSGTSNVSPTRQSIKRVKTPTGGGATADKGMQMSYEDLAKGDLGAMKDYTPKARDTDSAKAQMEELARVYKLKIRAAENKGKGLMADTLGAPTLEGPTLTKGTLTKKRFKDGGEAKKPGAESVEEPSIFGVSDYATKASARMYPDQMGQDDERDAARHMLAAATVSKKYGPGVAEFLGKAHERMSSPESFFSMFGIGKPREDYEMDVHNNRIGAQLAARATSQAELEKLVAAMARESRTKQTEGKPWTMSREQMANRKGQVMTPPPEYRADGSPEEGEIGPAFVTPKSGKGRKEGEISRQLKSGDAYINMAKGVTELPYDIAGAPVDLATMLLRPFGYGTEKPVMSSDWIKEKMTGAGVRPEPPADPTAKGFYTAGELLSNLTNPAGVARKAGPVVEKGVKAGAMEVGRQLDRAILDNAGPLAKAVPQAAKPLYAVRPTGSTMLSGPVGLNKNVSEVDQLLNNGISNARSVAGQNAGQEELIKEFWDKKARNYFMRQFGTPDDPIAAAISKKQIKGTALEEMFPEYMLDQIAAGKTRVNEQGQERFFPKYPRAMEDFTKRYDQATGLKGNLVTMDPAAADPGYNLISSRGREMARSAADTEADKMISQGLRPELINTEVGAVTRSVKDPERILSDGTSASKDMLAAFEEASAYKKMTPEQQVAWANEQFGNGRPLHGLDYDEVGKNLLAENVRTAIEKGQPVYDIGYMGKPLKTLFKPDNINTYLASLPPRELANIRFEDAVRGGLKMNERAMQLENVAERIKSGKPVADSVFSTGVSAPLLQFDQGPLEGFAWKRIEKREATVPEGAYVGHSVGGYETGGATYTQDKREGFNTGKWQVYTLRDNRNRPVNTIEVKMLDEVTPVVTQIKGNGRATGNTAPEKYDTAVLDFLQNYLKPAAIEESDSYLTPLLQSYKGQLGPSPRTR